MEIGQLTRQMVGAFGESSVVAELLRHGWIPANVNATVKNAARFDIYAVKDNKTVHLRVRACGPRVNGQFQVSGYKSDQPIPPENFSKTDFTILVNMGTVRGEDEFYIVPSSVIHDEVQLRQKAWLGSKRRDGRERADKGFWTLRLKERKDGQAVGGYGLGKKWAKYRGAWRTLEA